MTTPPKIFDRSTLRRRRDRCAHGLHAADFLFREVADRVADRLSDVNRSFPVAADIGSHGGMIRQELKGRGGIQNLIETDFSEGLARLSSRQNTESSSSPIPHHSLVADEECLPLAPNTFDLIMSSLSLHWVNDLPGTLLQINGALKPDGFFVGTMFGLGTLREFRECLMKAEMNITGGAAARISPFADVRDMGGLLQRAGFALPVVDSDTVNVAYQNPMSLLDDLRNMGETSCLQDRPKTFLRKDVLMQALELYVTNFADADGRVPATFEIIYLHGWHPDSSQQQALRPGSAKMSLSQALGSTPNVTDTKPLE